MFSLFTVFPFNKYFTICVVLKLEKSSIGFPFSSAHCIARQTSWYIRATRYSELLRNGRTRSIVFFANSIAVFSQTFKLKAIIERANY